MLQSVPPTRTFRGAAIGTDRRQRWNELSALLDTVSRRGVRALGVEQLKQLCRLYRQVTIDLSQARAAGEDPAVLQYLNSLGARAHGQVYSVRRLSLRPLLTFVG